LTCAKIKWTVSPFPRSYYDLSGKIVKCRSGSQREGQTAPFASMSYSE
jgi:hypothetical protein